MTSSLAAIHVARKQLGLDDDTYRAKLKNITGKTSAKGMSEEERQTVLMVFRNEGFKPADAARPANGRPQLTGKYAKKLQALWIAAWNLGIVEKRDDAALVTFVKRQTGIDHTRWLHYSEDATKAVEGLKGWIARAGGVEWAKKADAWQDRDGFKIALAQWSILGGEERDRPFAAFLTEVRMISGVFVPEMHDDHWIKVMNAFGRRIRAAKKKAGRR